MGEPGPKPLPPSHSLYTRTVYCFPIHWHKIPLRCSHISVYFSHWRLNNINKLKVSGTLSVWISKWVLKKGLMSYRLWAVLSTLHSWFHCTWYAFPPMSMNTSLLDLNLPTIRKKMSIHVQLSNTLLSDYTLGICPAGGLFECWIMFVCVFACPKHHNNTYKVSFCSNMYEMCIFSNNNVIKTENHFFFLLKLNIIYC